MVFLYSKALRESLCKKTEGKTTQQRVKNERKKCAKITHKHFDSAHAAAPERGKITFLLQKLSQNRKER
jgi:hypothetical protein